MEMARIRVSRTANLEKSRKCKKILRISLNELRIMPSMYTKNSNR